MSKDQIKIIIFLSLLSFIYFYSDYISFLVTELIMFILVIVFKLIYYLFLENFFYSILHSNLVSRLRRYSEEKISELISSFLLSNLLSRYEGEDSFTGLNELVTPDVETSEDLPNNVTPADFISDTTPANGNQMAKGKTFFRTTNFRTYNYILIPFCIKI